MPEGEEPEPVVLQGDTTLAAHDYQGVCGQYNWPVGGAPEVVYAFTLEEPRPVSIDTETKRVDM